MSYKRCRKCQQNAQTKIRKGACSTNKSKGRKSFLNYSFSLKQILMILGKVEYAKCIAPLKTRSKQNKLERVWELITNDPEWAVALQKQKIA